MSGATVEVEAELSRLASHTGVFGGQVEPLGTTKVGVQLLVTEELLSEDTVEDVDQAVELTSGDVTVEGVDVRRSSQGGEESKSENVAVLANNLGVGEDFAHGGDDVISEGVHESREGRWGVVEELVHTAPENKEGAWRSGVVVKEVHIDLLEQAGDSDGGLRDARSIRTRHTVETGANESVVLDLVRVVKVEAAGEVLLV